MSRNKTADVPGQDQGLVTAAEWFASGERIAYDPGSARVLTEIQAAATPGTLRVFERVVGAGHDADTVWLTMLPGFPDGSYGWAQVDRMLGDDLGPRPYVEPVGQGDSDKPRDYPYSTVERADLVEALWRHHGVRRTVVVTFDYTSLALLELLRRQLERTDLGGGQGTADTLFEVAIVHHTQCGTGFLADPGFRHQAAEAAGIPEAALEASAVTDPHATSRPTSSAC